MKIFKMFKWVFIIVALVISLVLWIIWGNKALVVTKIEIINNKIPKDFDGYKIVQISDLHNADFGLNNSKLLMKIEECQPDIIVLTGDMVDSHHTDINLFLDFAKESVKIAPTYFIAGNHESALTKNNSFNIIVESITENGVIILENTGIILEREVSEIQLLGLFDIGFLKRLYTEEKEINEIIDLELQQINDKSDLYTILITHRPEYIFEYAKNNIDLVLVGHAHGGQFRIPFIGGVYAPEQGIFPKYDSGLYIEKGTNMIVSRGLGNSRFPFRINNRPEIILVELRRN